MSTLFNSIYLSELIIEKRVFSIIGCLAILLICVQGLPRLTFNPDIENMFPENNSTAQLARHIDETFIPTENVVIAVNTSDDSVFTHSTLDVLERITEKAWTIPHSVRVDSITNYSYVRSVDDDVMVEPLIENALDLDETLIKQRAKAIEGEKAIFGALISKDKKTTIISITLDPPLVDQETALTKTFTYLLDYLEEMRLSNPELDIRLVGIPYIEYLSPKLIKSEVPIVMPTMLLLIFASVFILLRSLAAVVATVIVVFMSLLSAFGSMGHLGAVLNQLVITIPILITTLALADCVHVFSIYFQQVGNGHASKESMIKSKD